MKLNVSLSESSINDAIEALREAADNLEDNADKCVYELAEIGLSEAVDTVHKETRDLERSLHIEVIDGGYSIVADVVGSTFNPNYSDHIGSRYAYIEESRGGEHAYMSITALTLIGILPLFVTEISYD